MDENTRTLFNSAQKTLDRLNDRFDECNHASDNSVVNGLNVVWLTKWHSILQSINREIHCKYKTRLKEIEKSKKLFSEYLQLHPLIVYVNTQYEGKLPLVNKKVFHQRMVKLDEIEIYLRKVADERGMLNPTGTDLMGGVE